MISNTLKLFATLLMMTFLSLFVSAQNKPVKPLAVQDTLQMEGEVTVYNDSVRGTLSFPRKFEQGPQYGGGSQTLNRFFEQKIHYPEYEKEFGIEGLVVVNFTVNIDGSLSDISMARNLKSSKSIEPDLIGAIQQMPKWGPAFRNRKAIPVLVQIAVRYKYREKKIYTY